MELELKHLKGYLGTGLKMIFEKSGRIIELSGLQITDGENIIYACSDRFYESTVWNFKPLLLQLSALSERLPDGTIPIVELFKIATCEELSQYGIDQLEYNPRKDGSIVADYGIGALIFHPNNLCFFWLEYDEQITDSNGDKTMSIKSNVINQLQLFEYLYYIHADIHGLIPAGLAIDKRTVKI